MAWLMRFGFVPVDMPPGDERVKVSLPALAFTQGHEGAPPPAELVMQAQLVDSWLNCSDGFVLTPTLRAGGPGSVGVSTGGSMDLQDLKEPQRGGDPDSRFPLCWWARIVASHWPELLGAWAGQAEEPPDLLPVPWRGPAGRWLPGALAPLAESLRRLASRPTPWEQPSEAQVTWWQGAQRCAARQAEVLDSWVRKLVAEWS
uniref:Uncharacterized protein n=1 Tax=Alexandrium monilatum TaxID=311494 RepID=A0A7S4UFV9_9DINO